MKRRREKVTASHGEKAMAETEAAAYTAINQAPSSAPMNIAPRMSASEALVTISLRPAQSTASNTPTNPTTMRRPNTAGVAGLATGTGATAAGSAVNELIKDISGGNNYRQKSMKRQ
ncbi:hypothetical protein D3C78_1089850 [compost metagenome]